MKVLMLNGSPHEKGCTYTALAEVAGELNQAGIETEIMHVGGGTAAHAVSLENAFTVTTRSTKQWRR